MWRPCGQKFGQGRSFACDENSSGRHPLEPLLQEKHQKVHPFSQESLKTELQKECKFEHTEETMDKSDGIVQRAEHVNAVHHGLSLRQRVLDVVEERSGTILGIQDTKTRGRRTTGKL